MVMAASMTRRGVVGIGLMIVMPVLDVMIAIRVMVEIQGQVAEQHVMMLTAKQVLDSANGTGNGRLRKHSHQGDAKHRNGPPGK